MKAVRAAVLLASLVAVSACGQKGDPLPPLNRLPVAPESLTAERRAATVELVFTVPAANTDGTRPANIERVDIYALTGPPTTTADEVLRRGTRIASLDIKAPRDPDAVVDPDDDDQDLEPLVGAGLEQGVPARVTEDLSLPAPPAPDASVGLVRHYLGVGISTRGRRGLLSQRVAVALGPAPAAPARPVVTYDEQRVTVTWAPGGTAGGAANVTFHVYAVDRAAVPEAHVRMTTVPLPEARFIDSRIVWGAERCYAVRNVDTREGLSIESEASPLACVTLVDRFAPGVPSGLTAVASDGAINLTWDARTDADLAGYLVLRGMAADTLMSITPLPLSETNFRDAATPGTRYFYAVQAVDRSGNASQPSRSVDATAR